MVRPTTCVAASDQLGVDRRGPLLRGLRIGPHDVGVTPGRLAELVGVGVDDALTELGDDRGQLGDPRGDLVLEDVDPAGELGLERAPATRLPSRAACAGARWRGRRRRRRRRAGRESSWYRSSALLLLLGRGRDLGGLRSDRSSAASSLPARPWSRRGRLVRAVWSSRRLRRLVGAGRARGCARRALTRRDVAVRPAALRRRHRGRSPGGTSRRSASATASATSVRSGSSAIAASTP